MEAALQEKEIVPGTEGTEYEGMAEDAIERAEFQKAVNDDDDIEGKVEPDLTQATEEAGEIDPPEKSTEEPEAEEKEADPKPEEEKPEPTGFEWIADLPEEGQAKIKELMQRSSAALARQTQIASSHLGQLRPAQKLLGTLTEKVRDLKEELGKQRPTIDLEDRMKDLYTQIDEQYQEFPEEATKLKKQISDSLDGVADVLKTAQTPTPADTVVDGPDLRNERQHLETVYSDWGERRFSPEFQAWLTTQPNEIKALSNSGYASDNIELLDRFTQAHPTWMPPQTPGEFHTVFQAQYSPVFRAWAQGERINPDTDFRQVPDHERDMIMGRFRSDFGEYLSEVKQEQDDPRATTVGERRKRQLENRDPSTRRTSIKPGQVPDLNTEEGQRAYFQQLIDQDSDIT